METRFTDVYKHLKNKGFEVYFVGQHLGDALTDYVVIRDGGSSQKSTLSTQISYIELLCYVPESSFSRLEPLVINVKEAMKELFPMLKNTQYEQPAFSDDSNKSFMKTLQFQYNKQILETI